MRSFIVSDRDYAFYALNNAAYAIRKSRSSETPERRDYWAHMARNNIMAARSLRISHQEYPTIPA